MFCLCVNVFSFPFFFWGWPMKRSLFWFGLAIGFSFSKFSMGCHRTEAGFERLTDRMKGRERERERRVYSALDRWMNSYGRNNNVLGMWACGGFEFHGPSCVWHPFFSFFIFNYVYLFFLEQIKSTTRCKHVFLLLPYVRIVLVLLQWSAWTKIKSKHALVHLW